MAYLEFDKIDFIYTIFRPVRVYERDGAYLVSIITIKAENWFFVFLKNFDFQR